MKIQSIDNTTFELTSENESLGKLVYENLISYSAEIILPDGNFYDLSPAGIFLTSISVTQNELQIANLSMNWRGEVVISLSDGQKYVLKLKRFFLGDYMLEDQNGDVLVLLKPSFNWKKFQYTYELECNMQSNIKAGDPLLLLLAVFSANYIISAANMS